MRYPHTGGTLLHTHTLTQTQMLIRAWLQHFFAYEARNGGALPPHQLFPYNADADPCTGEASDASDRTAVAGTGSAENFPLSSLPAGPSAESEEDSAGGKRSASSSSPSTPAPPPPSSPPPSAAITTATKKTAKVRDVGCSAPAPGDPHEPPRFYSRYVFRRTVTGLQLLWGYFSFVVWNYLAHIRWYGASMVYLTTLVETEKSSAVALVVKERGAVTGSVAASNEDVQGELAFELHRLADQWLAVAYLAVALAGLIYTASAVLYVCVVNTPWHVRAAWPQPQLFTKACGARTGSTARDPHDSDAADPDNDPFLTYGSVLSRSSPFPPSSSTDVVPLSFTQPQFLFPLRRLTALDRVATASVRRSGLAVSPPRPPGQPYLSIQQQQQQQWHRGDPKAPLLWCACPLVVALVVFDFMVIHSCRVQGWPVRLLQGLTPALGLLLLLYTMKSVAVLCGRRCVVCWRALPIAVYTLTRPPTQPGYGPPGPWASQ
ncbi:hypothetical protein ABB37_07941 [Leptomonas pyrrhocoris]|uniref:Uncharacterized protein n=1 Tax=Leptomonas pyrrhocoris TaxID=157538 RepID=A0A0N0VDP9_LEPPY|nr:hypothetical protein ABB37_07941 [Leptomonas pyrrhocoris]KPA76182.1 hypothetical protein ABB37_07941 [Leptomonas pyrrhocoris]|eukprot:XP_015654621.1 hypothetical protein ABB37_07941 [Leptomonas pyrrhocoris]